MAYNKETDYQQKINEAVSKGDYESAAKYEKSRNEKIDSEKLPYQKTNNYSGWLDKTDYSNVIKKQISEGASKKSVSDTLKKRIEKASGTTGLTQYAYDDVYDKAVRYIMGSDFSYNDSAPVFESRYDDEIKDIYSDIKKMDEFKYDAYDDELYEYYKKLYNREGKRAMENLLGELSMNTGGVASSYAVSAAGQMLDYYNTKLTDKIPELYADAYDRYLDQIDAKEDAISVLTKLYDNDYSQYLDMLSQYNKDREFDYRSYTDMLDRDYEEQEFNAKMEENERERLLEKEMQEYENAQKEQEKKIETALKKWEKLGYLDSESAQILGLPPGLHTSDYDYKKAQQYKLYKN